MTVILDSKPVNKKVKTPILIKYFRPLIIILPVTVLLLGYFLLVRGELSKYNQQKDQSFAVEASLDAKLDHLVKLRQNVVDYENISLIDREKIDAILPENLNESDLYVNLESIAKDSHVNMLLKSINIQPAKEQTSKSSNQIMSGDSRQPIGSAVEKVDISLSLSGVNYANLKALISALEENLRLFDVQTFNFNPSPEVKALELSLTSYYLK